MKIAIKTLWLISGLSAAHAQDATTYELSSGAVVSVEVPMIYAANPTGKVIAINAENGSIVWTSAEVGRPLAVVENQLIVLAQSQLAGKTEIALLSLNKGTRTGALAIDLPNATAVILPLPNQIFTSTSQRTETGLRIFWEFDSRALQGAAMQGMFDDESQSELSSIGAFEIDMRVGGAETVRRISLANRSAIPRISPNLATAERVLGLAGEQFRAANDAHLMTRKTQADARFGSVYRWSISSRAGASLGAVTLPYSYAPFSLIGTRLVTHLPPYAVRLASGEADVYSTRIASFNLQTGAELWSVDVLDPVYRGVLPP